MSDHSNLTLIQAAISAGALLIAEHYFPYRALIGHKLPRVIAYVLGVLAVIVPWTLALMIAPNIPPVQSLFLLFVIGGIVVSLCYGLDDWSEHRRKRKEAEEREANLRNELVDGCDGGQD